MKTFKIVLSAFFVTLLFNSCIKDHCKQSYRMYIPIYKSRDAVLSEVKLLSAKNITKSGKIFSYANYLFINDIDKGIHIVDNANPASPVKVGFLNIEGNLDLWVRNGLLYADCYDNLLVIDIHDMHNIKLLESVQKVFPDRIFEGGVIDAAQGYVIGWEQRDTTVNVDCNATGSNFLIRGKVAYSIALNNASSSSSFTPTNGIPGSLSRFNSTGNFLYCVDNSNIHTFDITNQKPAQVSNIAIGFGIETIFSMNNNLFLGTNTGLLIYTLANPANPVYVTKMQHVRTCDPVIADDKNAFVTLRGGSPCGGFSNQLDVLDVSNLQNVSLVKSYALTNPYGLGMDSKYLFICDEGYGVRVFDRADVNLITEKAKIDIEHPRDIIVLGNTLLILTDTKMVQYNDADIKNIQWISEIN